MKALKKALAVLLSLIMVIGIMPISVITAFASTEDVYYYDKNGTYHNVTAVVLTGSETELTEGWYLVNSNIVYSSDLAISGEVNIILLCKIEYYQTHTGMSSRLIKNTLSFTGAHGIVKAEENTQANLNLYTNHQYETAGPLYANCICVDNFDVVHVVVNVLDTISADSITVYKNGNVKTNILSAKSVNTNGNNGKPSAKAECFTGEFDTVDICGNFSCTDMSALTADKLELGYNILNDRIYIGSFGSGISQISIKNGQTLTDEENIYSGDVNASDIEGKTLRAAQSAITYEENEHGTVSGVSEAMKDEEVTVTVTPNDGYQLYSLVYEEVNGNQVDIKDNKFKMPSGDITVKAVFIDNNAEEFLTEHINKVTIDIDFDKSSEFPFPYLSAWNSAAVYYYNFKNVSDYYNDRDKYEQTKETNIQSYLCQYNDGNYYKGYQKSTTTKDYFNNVKLYVDFGGGLTHYDWGAKVTIEINGVTVKEQDIEASSSWLSSSDKSFTISIPKEHQYVPSKIKYHVKSADSEEISYDKTLYQSAAKTDGTITGRVYIAAADQYGVYWNDWSGSLVSTTHPDTDTATFIGTDGNYSIWEVTSTSPEDHHGEWQLELTQSNGNKVFYDKTFDLDLNFVHHSGITYGNFTNGKVTGVKKANHGKEVALTVTPDNGYELETLRVVDSQGNDIPVSDDYKFTMPMTSVTVSATFKECPHYYDGTTQCTWLFVNEVPAAATFYFTCTNPFCQDSMAVRGTITEQDTREKVLYIATAEFLGETYTDTRVKRNKAFSSVNISATDNGTVTSDLSGAYEDETVTLSFTPDDGYRLRNVTVTDENGNSIDLVDGKFTMPASDVTVTAEFAKIYTITYLTLSHGSISGVTNAISGEMITVISTPEDGYALEQVSIQDPQGNTYPLEYKTFVMPESNVYVLANFTQGTAINYVAENGKVLGLRYAHQGDEIELTITPDENYRFVSVSAVDDNGNSLTITNNKFIMPSVPVTVTAVFEPIPRYTVEWSVRGTVVETDNDLLEGTVPEYNGETPSAYFDENGTEYVFAGWSPAVSAVTANTVYSATYVQSGRIVTSYIDRNGELQSLVATRITSNTTEMTDGWYVVNENVTDNNRISVSGSVNLILADGAKLTAPNGIGVIGENSLTIWEQLNKTGELQISVSDYYKAGIGGENNINTGTIIINGGIINSTGGPGAAGIGGGYSAGGIVTINGGTVTATGGDSAAAIGGGCRGSNITVTINGGTVTATASRDGAGIGSGYYGNNVSVTINGGTVVAFGKGNAAGIGGGENSPANVTVTGGDIQALSGNVNVGIGGGYGSIESDSNISVTYTDDISIRAAAYYGNLTLEKALTDSGHSFVVSAGVITDKSQLAGNTMVPYAPNSITYVSEGNGTVTGPSSAYYGEEIAPTFKADKYYKFQSYIAQPDGGTTLDIYNNKFTMPAKNVTVTARFVDSSYNVKYLDENGIEQTVKAYPLDPNYTEYDGGWYIVDKNITYTEDLKFNGTANLILANGVTLSVTGSSAEIVANTLNIYWQNHKNGALNAQMVAFNLNIYGGVIYPKNIYAGYNLNIYDGNIDVDKISCSFGAATVYGGNLNITKEFYSRGITLGYSKASDSIYSEAYSLYKGDLKIAEGQIFTDGTNTYSGTVTSLQIEQITLTPYKPQAITYAASEHGLVTGLAMASAGAEVTLTIAPEIGYALDTLTVKDENNNYITVTNGKFTMPEADITVTATFKKADLYIGYNYSEGGTVVGPTTANIGDEITLTVNTDAGYELDTLIVKDSNNNEITVTDGTFTMPGTDVTVTASFNHLAYTVTWVVDGSVVETDENVPYGDTPSFDGIIELYYFDKYGVGYIFAGWSPEIDAVTGDITYTAVYSNSGEITTQYIDSNGEVQTVIARVLTGEEDELTDGWYIVSSDIEYNSDLLLSGNVNIILGGFATMSSNSGFECNSQSNLNIYRQYAMPGTMDMTVGNDVFTSLNVYGGTVKLGNVTADNIGVHGGVFSAQSLSVTNNGEITLGCNTSTSNITVGSFSGTVVIADGQTLADADRNTFSGNVIDNSAIAGKTLALYVMLYDINEDGFEDINDIAFIIAASVGEIKMTATQEVKADLNGDRVVDAFDAAYLDKFLY